MTRAAARAAFERYLEELLEETAEAFSVVNVLRGQAGPAGAVAEGLLDRRGLVRRRLVEPELRAHRENVRAGFEVVLDSVEAGEPVDAYATQLLEHDTFWDALDDVDPDRREAVRTALLSGYADLADAIEPLVRAEAEEFWPALRAELDREEAAALVERTVSFTEPAREHREAFTFSTSLDPSDLLGGVGRLFGGPVEVEFTDEAIRAMSRAEARVVRSATREVRRRYDEG